MIKRWCENPVNGGPDVVLASDYDALIAAVKHLREELSSKTGATVDVYGTRYECHPAIAARITELEQQYIYCMDALSTWKRKALQETESQ